MDFKSWSTERASHFELCAKKALPPDNRLPWKLHEAMRYAVLDGGKRKKLYELAAALKKM